MSLESGYTATLIVHRPASAGGEYRVVFETWEDGGVAPNSVKHRNPVTRAETARGGLASREDVTLTREYDDVLQNQQILEALEDSSGRDRCTAIKQMVDGRATAIGKPYTLTGYVGEVTGPSYNLSGDAVGMLSVGVSTDEKRA